MRLKQLGGLAAILAAIPAAGAELDFGPGWTATWTNTVTENSMWRTTNPNPSLYTAGDGARIGLAGGYAGSGNDAGDLNYLKGDLIQTRLTLLSEFAAEKNNAGIVVSGKAWTNRLGENRDVRYGNESNNYTPNQPLDDSAFPALMRQQGVYLLDAFAYDTFKLFGNPLQIRLGNQVLNWGESLFIQGINQISPLDTSALRTPGTEIKEALLPVPMVSGSYGLGGGISVDGFLQFINVPTAVDGCGSYWETIEVPVASNPGSCKAAAFFGAPSNPAGLAAGTYVPVANGPNPRGFDQYGFALHAPVDPIDTEFGLYYTNLTARVPLFSTITGSDFQSQVKGLVVSKVTPAVAAALPGAIAASCGPTPVAACQSAVTSAVTAQVTAAVQAAVQKQLGVGALLIQPEQVMATTFGGAPFSGYWEYPGDVHTYGASASTTIYGWSVGSELSYSPNTPVQLNAGDVLAGALLGIGPLGPTYQKAAIGALGGAAGNLVPGYTRVDKWQYQLNAVNTYANVLWAEQAIVAGEAGFEWANLPSNLRYGRAFTYQIGSDPTYGAAPAAEMAALGIGPGGNTCAGLNKNPAGCANSGYDTPFSWGFRVRGQLQYDNIFGSAVNFFPSVSISADMQGSSIDNQFIQDRRQYGVGAKFVYMNNYSVAMNYTTYNHSAKYDPLEDRDFFALTFSAKY
jgi:hypothetical protein